MRTTVNLDDDVLETARAIALVERRPLGEVISRLVRRALAPTSQASATPSGFPTFRVPSDAPPITQETVRAALDEL